jgi:predicted NAD/FAD-binding protein
VCIEHNNGEKEYFDEVVLACHSDQAVALLADPDKAEIDVVGGMHYQDNEVVLHTDRSVLPERKHVWSAWNYRLTHDENRPASVSYYMNLLQGIDSDIDFCVTLNDTDQIDPSKILKTYHYQHPLFTLTTQKNQALWHVVNGKRNTWFCGAYWRNGFHEDGVVSGLRVVNALAKQYNLTTDCAVID